MLKYLQRKEKNSHWAGMHTLVKRWKMNVDKDGDRSERCLQQCSEVL
jgi:hypothetical protein